MNLEYLVVGIARENPDDLKEFCSRTKSGAFGLALAYTKDRFLAKEIVVEAYRRVIKYAYKFDTDMNAEYWLLDIVKNISINALCDGEFSRIAAEQHTENVSTLLRQAIMDTDEDRGKIIALRLGTDLSKAEVARLLWYNKASSDGEFVRGIKQLAAMAPQERSREGVEEQLSADIKECTPEILEAVLSEKETALCRVSHKNYMIGDDELALPGESNENRKQRIAAKKASAKKKTIITVCIVAAVVVALIAGGLIWRFIENGDTKLKEPDSGTVDVTEPQYDTSVAVAEKDGVVYYQNLADGGRLYSLDLKASDGKPVKLSDDKPKELLIEGDYIYYRNEADGRLYRRAVGAAAGGESEPLNIIGAAVNVFDGRIYYSSKEGISRAKLDGSEVEVIYDATNEVDSVRYDIEVAEDGCVYFSAGYKEGFYRLVPTSEGYTKEELNSTLNVYTFKTVGSSSYFDIDNLDANLKTGSIYRITVTEKEFVETEVMSAVTRSAAFFVNDGYVYYYGCRSVDEKTGQPLEKGIYRILSTGTTDSGVVGGSPELVISMEGREYDVSDMYMSDGYLYCYSSNGEKENKYMVLEAFGIDDNGLADGKTSKVIFSSKAK